MSTKINNPLPPIRLWRYEVTSDPASGNISGEVILNTTTEEVKVWYDGAWVVIHDFGSDLATYDFMDGLDFLFMDGTGFDFMDA